MTLKAMRKYIIRALAGKSWLSKWITLQRVNAMSAGEVLRTFYLLTDRRPIDEKESRA